MDLHYNMLDIGDAAYTPCDAYRRALASALVAAGFPSPARYPVRGQHAGKRLHPEEHAQLVAAFALVLPVTYRDDEQQRVITRYVRIPRPHIAAGFGVGLSTVSRILNNLLTEQRRCYHADPEVKAALDAHEAADERVCELHRAYMRGRASPGDWDDWTASCQAADAAQQMAEQAIQDYHHRTGIPRYKPLTVFALW